MVLAASNQSVLANWVNQPCFGSVVGSIFQEVEPQNDESTGISKSLVRSLQ